MPKPVPKKIEQNNKNIMGMCHNFLLFGISVGIKWRMKDIGQKISFYYLKMF
jgi:hypothetical protein